DASGFMVHGTPFWSGRKGPALLAGIHSLGWGREALMPMSPPAALRHLIANLSLVVDDVSSRERAFAAAARVAAAVPAHRLFFEKSSDVDAIAAGRRRAA